MLPEIRPSSIVWAETDPAVFGRPIPIAGVAGDQQAATFGQACFEPGSAKNTYGTGAFLLANVGDRPVASSHGLLSTVLWQLGDQRPVAYALEGSVFIAGAAVQWLRDGLRAVASADEVEALIAGVEDTGGVYLVPAFVGLGAPHWDPHARGLLIGLTRGTGLPEIARAAIESIAYQVLDVAEAMAADRGGPIETLRADGGAARDDELLRFQADILGVPVERPRVIETTAWGAASLAGLAVGQWGSLAELAAIRQVDRRFAPAMAADRRADLLRGWHRAVERSKGWASPG
jgi:glycerol kinase